MTDPFAALDRLIRAASAVDNEFGPVPPAADAKWLELRRAIVEAGQALASRPNDTHVGQIATLTALVAELRRRVTILEEARPG